MDIGERLVRTRGVNGFAFREIADTIGIKSASVHYHFPTKADLIEAIMARYHQQFLAVLSAIKTAESNPRKRLERLIKFYRGAINEDRTLTLCMMMGHEKSLIPAAASAELSRLMTDILNWLTELCLEMNPELSRKKAKEQATFIHSCLQGGILGSSAVENSNYFDQVARQLKNQVFSTRR